MADRQAPPPPWIAVIGDRTGGHEPQEAIEPAVHHAASALGIAPPAVRWMATDRLEAAGPSILAGSSAVWVAPGGPFLSMAGALSGIRWAREARLPVLGTCAGFQLGVVEFARNVLGRDRAAHAEYQPADPAADLFIDELLCSLVGQRLEIQLIDPELMAGYGTDRAVERYYCRFGLAPGRVPALEAAGLRVAGTDVADGEPRILRLGDHPWYVLTLFVPQTSSSPERPHPLVVGYLHAMIVAAGEARTVPLPDPIGSDPN